MCTQVITSDKLCQSPSFSRCLPTNGPRALPGLSIHPPTEVEPPRPRDLLVRLGDRSRALLEDVQQHDELFAPAIQDTEERPAIVAPQFPQLSFDLGAMRKREMWMVLVEQIDTINLPIDGEPHRSPLPFDKLINGLRSIGRSIELHDETASRVFAHFVIASTSEPEPKMLGPAQPADLDALRSCLRRRYLGGIAPGRDRDGSRHPSR